MAVWYLGSTKWTAVSVWTTVTVTAAGVIRRQVSPAAGLERVFVCIIAGITGASEPSWVATNGATTTDATVTWMECTGKSAVNGDATNTVNWTTVKNTAVAAGFIIQRNNGVSYQICTTAGTAGNGAEPGFSDTAGTTTADNTVTWTSLGAVGNFGGYAAPFARLGSNWTVTWAVAGDITYMSNNHAETQSTAISVTSPGTAASMCPLYCVSDTAVPPTTLATTGSITTTGTSAMSFAGFFYMYGVTLNVGTGAGTSSFSSNITTTTSQGAIFDTCNINLVGTSAGALITLGSGAATGSREVYSLFKDCTFKFGAVGQAFSVRVGLHQIINGTFAATGSVPTVLIKGNTATQGNLTIRDSNLNAVTTTLADISTATRVNIELDYCRLGAGVTMTTGAVVGWGGMTFKLHNCDSTTTNYRFYEANYWGVIQQSTSVFRASGFTNGTTPQSGQIVTNSVTSFYSPYISPEMVIWHDTTGVVLAPVLYLTCASSLTNADVYVEWEYMGSASFPIGTSDITSRAASVFASTTALTTDSTSTWTGGLGNNYKISPTNFTPNMKGPVKARIYVIKASTTLNFDLRWPMVDTSGNVKSSGRQYLIPGYGFISETGPSFVNSNMIGGMNV